VSPTNTKSGLTASASRTHHLLDMLLPGIGCICCVFQPQNTRCLFRPFSATPQPSHGGQAEAAAVPTSGVPEHAQICGIGSIVVRHEGGRVVHPWQCRKRFGCFALWQPPESPITAVPIAREPGLAPRLLRFMFVKCSGLTRGVI